MDIRHLTPDQHAKLKVQAESMLDYLQRLLGRLDDCRFTRDGEFFQKALHAQRAVHEFWEFIEFNPPRNDSGKNGLPF